MYTRRSITAVAIVWTLIIITGFVANGLSLKVSGYPQNRGWVNFNPVAEIMRLYGGWLILAPVIWTYFAGRALSDERDSSSFSILLYLGGGLALLTAVLFIYGAVCPCTEVARTADGF